MGKMASETQARRTAWQQLARRIRVPLGFATAALFVLFARPTPALLGWSLLLVLPGLWLRAYAAGYVRKNSELTRTGPYAYTRNPLYLGSMSLAFGFAVAAGRLGLGLLLAALFLLIYVPTIQYEEAFLRAAFPGFDDYARRVPRLLPRLTPARFPGENAGAGRFDRERWLHHREYNALMGAAAVYVFLVARMFLLAHRH